MATIIYYVTLFSILPAWLYFIWAVHKNEGGHFKRAIGILILIFLILILCLPSVEPQTARDLINKLK